MKKKDKGITEVKEVYRPGQERTYCDGCGQEIHISSNMELQFNDFGDDDAHIPAQYESWDFCGFRCFGIFYSNAEHRKKLQRLISHSSTKECLQFSLNESDLSVMADASNLLKNESGVKCKMLNCDLPKYKLNLCTEHFEHYISKE